MRKAFISAILISLMCYVSFAQTQELPNDSLIKKYRAKTITQYSHYESDSNIVSYIKIWKYDSLGRLYFEQLIDKDTSEGGDTSFSGKYYFYDKNKLVKSWDIGVWNVKTMKVDTAVTNYFYNEIDSLIEVIYKNPVVGSNSIKFNYQNGYLVKKTYKDIPAGFVFASDSLVNFPNGKVSLEFYKLNGFMDGYKYNNQQQLISITEKSTNDTSTINRRTEFYYTNGQLTKEIEKESNFFKPNEKQYYNERGYNYYYNKSGLLKEITNLNGNDLIERYEYEFY